MDLFSIYSWLTLRLSHKKLFQQSVSSYLANSFHSFSSQGRLISKRLVQAVTACTSCTSLTCLEQIKESTESEKHYSKNIYPSFSCHSHKRAGLLEDLHQRSLKEGMLEMVNALGREIRELPLTLSLR